MSTAAQVGDAGELAWYHRIGCAPLPEPEPLDADQLEALEANPLHERKWGFGR